MKHLFVPIILIATALSGCKSKSELYADFQNNFAEREKFQHCWDIQIKYGSRDTYFTEKFYDEMFECRKTATPEEIALSNQSREIRIKLHNEQQAVDESNIIAREKLSVIRAKNRVNPTDERQKLIYCETYPKWREHGYEVSLELKRRNPTISDTLFGNEPEYLEPRNILDCFNSVRSEAVIAFMNKLAD